MVVNPWTTGSAVEVEGERHDPARAPLGIDRIVSAGYFRTLAIPLEAGRTFEERDGPTAPPVAIVSRALARRLWPERDPIGRRIRLRSTPWLTIVGVAGDVRHPLRDEPRPVLYRPHTQGRAAWLYLVARTSSPPADRIAAAAAALRALDPEQPLAEGGSVEETLDAALSEPRFNLVLVCIFAAIALLLALVGIHGLIAYSVGRRTREIGIRMALGARADEVVALVGRSGARLALAGVALGTVSAWLLARAMAGIVYGIAPTRPWTFAAAAAFLLAVSSAASYFPARRASRVDPIVALRSE
jgi:putative ABC transport system permease protein